MYDVLAHAMFLASTLPVLFVLFVFFRWVGVFMWCTMVAYLLFEAHYPDM